MLIELGVKRKKKKKEDYIPSEPQLASSHAYRHPHDNLQDCEGRPARRTRRGVCGIRVLVILIVRVGKGIEDDREGEKGLFVRRGRKMRDPPPQTVTMALAKPAICVP